jgi:hypothetical protein
MPTTLNGRTWPAYLPRLFKIFRENGTGANRYNGPYQNLLHSCFGTRNFMIAPGAELNTDRCHKSNDFLVVYDLGYRPVLITEAKDDHWANSARLRFEADKRIRQQYDVLLPECPLPRLWGLSLLGTSVRFYVGDVATGEVEPGLISRPGGNFPYNFLAGAWGTDILSHDGFDKMREIVHDINSHKKGE